MTADRRVRDRKWIKHLELCKRVIERIKDGWIPEQIGNRMIHEHAKLRHNLWWYLPTHRGAPVNAENPNSTATSVSCSAQTT
ncbi:MAG: hypothetical protein ABJ327_13055 [Litoreibacter sp.]